MYKLSEEKGSLYWLQRSIPEAYVAMSLWMHTGSVVTKKTSMNVSAMILGHYPGQTIKEFWFWATTNNQT